MPLGLRGGRPPAGDVERAPLSDGGEPANLPPYTDYKDAPLSKQRQGRGKGGGVEGDGDPETGGGKSGLLPSRGGPVRPFKHHRGGLVCAYLQHWLACRCCHGDGVDSSGAKRSARSRLAERVFMGLFYLVVLVVSVSCAAAVGYIVAQEGNPLGRDENVVADLAGSQVATLGSNDFFTALDEVCSAESLQTLEGIQGCHDKCQTHLCCFTDEGFAAGNGHCDVDLNHNHSDSCVTYKACHAKSCAAYEPCKRLIVPEGAEKLSPDDSMPLADVADSVEQYCSLRDDAAARVDGGWVSNCHAVCAPRLCCLLDPSLGSSCRGALDPEECAPYAPCKGLIDTDTDQGQVTMDPRASGQIEQVCDADLILNGKGPSACESLCKQRSCCFEEEAAYSCYNMEKEWCDEFKSCTSIGFSFLKPTLLTVVGAPLEGPAVGAETSNDDNGMSAKDPDTSELQSNDLEDGPDIAEVCTSEYIAQSGALDCSNACQPVHCCFSGEHLCEEVRLGHLICDDYKECGVLYSAQESSKELFEMAKHIDEICTEENVSTLKGRSECQGLCYARLCCFDHGSYGCADDPNQNCIAYAGCGILVSTGKKDDQPTDPNKDMVTVKQPGDGELENEVDDFITALEIACSEDSLKTLEGIQQCHNKCQTHLCCFTDDTSLAGNGNCENIHIEACNAYKSCERLVTPHEGYALTDDSMSINDVAESIGTLCALPTDPSLIDEDWVTKCHAICAPRLCCLVDSKIGSNCRDAVGSEECSAYNPCEVLVDPNKGEVMLDPKAVGNIENVCEIDLVQNLKERNACEFQCKQRSCCFEDEAAYSCYAMEQEWCNEFKACSSIDLMFMELESRPSNPKDDEGEPTVDVFTSEMEKACSEDSLKTLDGIQRCHDKCQTHLCCFTDDGFLAGEGHCDDVNIHPDSCVAYEACKRLVVLEEKVLDYDSMPVANLAESVYNYCSLPDDPSLIDEAWVTNCHAICAPRLCCVLDAKIGSNCRDAVESDECAAYAPCEVLIDVKHAQEMSDPHAIGDIENVCGVDMVQNLQERDACEFLCKQRSCCFEDEAAYSCYYVERDWCDEFKACSSLSGITLAGRQFGDGDASTLASTRTAMGRDVVMTSKTIHNTANKPTDLSTEAHPLNPQWFQTTHADYQLFLKAKEEPGNNALHDWHGANILCGKQGLSLCGYDAYCPNGPGGAPFHGGPPKLFNHATIDETQWSPFMPTGPTNNNPTGTHWIQIGHLSTEEGGSEENSFIQCWKYDDWYAGNGVDIIDVWEAKHRVHILCCNRGVEG